MKAVQLSDKIRYLHFPSEDDQEPVAIMVFVGDKSYPTRVQEIGTPADFRFWYNKFKAAEQRLSLETTLSA